MLQAKALLYLLMALFYDIVLYWYMYTRLHDGAQRADLLGLCSSIMATLIMILPAFEVVSVSHTLLYAVCKLHAQSRVAVTECNDAMIFCRLIMFD